MLAAGSGIIELGLEAAKSANLAKAPPRI